MCLAHGDCYEQRSRRLYPGVEECEEAGERAASQSAADLAEEGFLVAGYTCRALSD